MTKQSFHEKNKLQKGVHHAVFKKQFSMMSSAILFAGLLLAGSACSEKNPTEKNTKPTKPLGNKATATVKAKTYTGNLDAIVANKKLRVLTPAQNRGFLPRAGSPLSFEHEMATRLATELNVKLEEVHPPSYDQLIPWLLQGRGDVILANLTASKARSKKVQFTDPIRFVREVLISSVSASAIHEIKDLAAQTVVVRRSSSFWQSLQKIKATVPDLIIKAADESLDTETLIEQVGQGKIAHTVADNMLAEAVLGYRDDVRIDLAITDARPLGWAVSPQAPKLLHKLNVFLSQAALTGHKEKLQLGDLDAMKKRGVLRVLTRNNAINYWLYRGREVGFEYDMVKALADKLGLRLEMVIPPRREDLIPWLQQGRADLIAAGLTDIAKRRAEVDFSPPTMQIQQILVMPSGTAIHGIKDLAGQRIFVRASSSYAEQVKKLSKTLAKPIEIVSIDEDEEFEEIVNKVALGKYSLTVLDSNLADFALASRPQLVKGPALTETQNLAWAMRKNSPKLMLALKRFLTNGDYKPHGLMYNILKRRYFGKRSRQRAQKSATPVNAGGAISPYDALLKKYAQQYHLDWRLLAAQMYQESRFNKDTKSWVGALGLMQIMPQTAAELGVGDPRVPENSVKGGAKYMRKLIDRYDPTLAHKDRLRFALAAYNAGPGHLADARRLAAKLKLNDKRWFGNVEKAMLLLSHPQYARHARYGYVRGQEPVHYVSEIQTRFEAYSKLAP